jgi:hypothetical protein
VEKEEDNEAKKKGMEKEEWLPAFCISQYSAVHTVRRPKQAAAKYCYTQHGTWC